MLLFRIFHYSQRLSHAYISKRLNDKRYKSYQKTMRLYFYPAQSPRTLDN